MAADLTLTALRGVLGQAAESRPIILVRGFPYGARWIGTGIAPTPAHGSVQMSDARHLVALVGGGGGETE
jgi:hypothetical protein